MAMAGRRMHFGVSEFGRRKRMFWYWERCSRSKAKAQNGCRVRGSVGCCQVCGRRGGEVASGRSRKIESHNYVLRELTCVADPDLYTTRIGIINAIEWHIFRANFKSRCNTRDNDSCQFNPTRQPRDPVQETPSRTITRPSVFFPPQSSPTCPQLRSTRRHSQHVVVLADEAVAAPLVLRNGDDRPRPHR